MATRSTGSSSLLQFSAQSPPPQHASVDRSAPRAPAAGTASVAHGRQSFVPATASARTDDAGAPGRERESRAAGALLPVALGASGPTDWRQLCSEPACSDLRRLREAPPPSTRAPRNVTDSCDPRKRALRRPPEPPRRDEPRPSLTRTTRATPELHTAVTM